MNASFKRALCSSIPALSIRLVLVLGMSIGLSRGAELPAQVAAAPADQTPANLGSLPGLQGLPGFADNEPAPVTVEAHFTLEGEREGALVVTAILEEGFHIYSLTQPAGGPQPSEIRVSQSQGVEIQAEFQPVPEPKSYVDQEAWPGVTIEEHHEQVTWTAPIELAAGVDPSTLEIAGALETLACADRCILLELPFVARYVAPRNTAPALVGETSEGKYQKPGSRVSLRGHVEPAVVAPGQAAELVITAIPEEEWHVYAREDRDPKQLGSKPTLIVIDAASGLKSYKAATDAKIVVDEMDEDLPTVRYHEGDVTWRIRLDVPVGTSPGPQTVSGLIGFQACKTACEPPQAARFQATLQVADAAAGQPSSRGQEPVTFAAANYNDAARLAAELPIPPLAPGAEPEQVTNELADYPLWEVLGFALVGGLILNLMPCVLPVIGLKILSFATQGGQSRGRILGLNLTYSAGLLGVFLLLATLASLVHLGLSTESYGWGELYTLPWFKIGMACLVFAMALSFLGVWEIPIPGFATTGAATELAAKEGYLGAFFKGIFTTVLATPCSAPLLGPVFGYTIAQPPWMTYLIFTAVGLGMAAPYILIGFFPRLIAWLPKPGAWMETFKQLMAFLLLGTVVFLISTISEESVIATLSLLVAIGFACWWIGRVRVTAPITRKAAAWLGGTAVAAFVGWLFLVGLKTPELPWQPWTPDAVAVARAEGKTVLVDFTADWCWNCKLNLKRAINTDEVREIVDENDVVPLLADFTDRSPAIKDALRQLNSISIPLLAVYPPDADQPPIILRDLVSQQQVLDALEQAGPSTGAERTAKRPSRSRGDQVAITRLD